MNDQKKIGTAFVKSVQQRSGLYGSSKNLNEWFAERKSNHVFSLQQIPFSELKNWSFETKTGNLSHCSGGFFRIEGVRVETNWGNVPVWEQPIINQPEIGYLGFITKDIGGILHFLIQAKMEPGNIDLIQLAPTLQATRSNFTRIHQGRKPLYLEYFTDKSSSKVLADALQSEQGARFLRKRNRNIIIKTEEEIPVYDDFCWMSLGEILHAMKQNNLINMDARTVLSCIPFNVDDVTANTGQLRSKFGISFLRSLSNKADSLYTNEEIISWFTDQKFRYELDVKRIPLSSVTNWERNEYEIKHESGRFFSVIACSVEADNREVASWTQPLVKAHQKGLIAYVVKEFNGVLHFLVQAKVEPGNFDVVEMAPTVQCLTGSYQDSPPDRRPPFVEYVLNAPQEKRIIDTLQSEEGGRFFREENRNIVIDMQNDSFDFIPDNYIWMTAGQLKEFIKYNNFVNVQARSLLSSLNFK